MGAKKWTAEEIEYLEDSWERNLLQLLQRT